MASLIRYQNGVIDSQNQVVVSVFLKGTWYVPTQNRKTGRTDLEVCSPKLAAIYSALPVTGKWVDTVVIEGKHQ